MSGLGSMSEIRDVYAAWLGIPESEQPPNFYRLLGLEQFEPELGKIEAAIAATKSTVRERCCESYEAASAGQPLLQHVMEAADCLTDPQKKAAYDSELRASFPTTVLPQHPKPGHSVDLPPVSLTNASDKPPTSTPSSAAESTPDASTHDSSPNPASDEQPASDAQPQTLGHIPADAEQDSIDPTASQPGGDDFDERELEDEADDWTDLPPPPPLPKSMPDVIAPTSASDANPASSGRQSATNATPHRNPPPKTRYPSGSGPGVAGQCPTGEPAPGPTPTDPAKPKQEPADESPRGTTGGRGENVSTSEWNVVEPTNTFQRSQLPTDPSDAEREVNPVLSDTGTCSVDLGKSEWIIGSSPQCDVVVESIWASKAHCKVYREGDKLMIADLDSTNGTFVNRRKIDRPHVISIVDLITLGREVRLRLPLTLFPHAQRSLATIYIGRLEGNDLQLPDPSVSSYHARVVRHNTQLFLEDLGSTNGTHLENDGKYEPIQKHQVQPGDKFKVGGCVLSSADIVGAFMSDF